ncbi:MAG: hypothetical protein K1060chlam4_00302 [Candidatus Anoxychlamydiales bacterium]|nr:hypothetical protein [Candidatus Anoxychlamydiales bacterium]
MTFISNKTLATVCGGLACGVTSYACGGSNNSMYIASAIGAIAARFIFNSIPESGFEPLKLNIDRFRSLGDIDKASMFSHQCATLAKKDLCSYLRKMDTQEYGYVKNEHEDAIKALNLKAPVVTGLGVSIVWAGISAVAMWPIKGMIDVLVFTAGLTGLSFGAVHLASNVKDAAKIIEKNRASRLEDKLLKLSGRVESLTDCPRENHQLQLANGYFSRALQAHSNKITVDYR